MRTNKKNADSGKSYSELLRDPRWQKKRLQIMERDKFRCKLCKDEETELQVHHKEYINGNNPWEYENSQLITLCRHCHAEIEILKREGRDISEFNEIVIYKSDGWTSGSRIMYVVHRDDCAMQIYSDDEYVIGFNLDSEIPEIIKILKKAMNYKFKDEPSILIK